VIFETGSYFFHPFADDGAKFVKIVFRDIFGVITGMRFYSVEACADEAGFGASGGSENALKALQV